MMKSTSKLLVGSPSCGVANFGGSRPFRRLLFVVQVGNQVGQAVSPASECFSNL
jgi:hypothetical protein